MRRTVTLKDRLKRLLCRSGCFAVRRLLARQSLVILAYHSVAPDRLAQQQYIGQGITVTVDTFRTHARLLRERFSPVSIADIAAWLARERELPPRSVAVTFDDGFADNYACAAPILEEQGICGAFYLTANAVHSQSLPWFCKMLYLFQNSKAAPQTLRHPDGEHVWHLSAPEEHRAAYEHHLYAAVALPAESREEYIQRLADQLGVSYDQAHAPSMMTWEMARELARRGHLIGNHSFSHPNIAHLPPECLAIEIQGAHRLLEEQLGLAVEHFSYPHPCLNPQRTAQSEALLRQLGYKTSVLTDYGRVRHGTSPFRLPRVCVGEMDADALLWKLETALAGVAT